MRHAVVIAGMPLVAVQREGVGGDGVVGARHDVQFGALGRLLGLFVLRIGQKHQVLAKGRDARDPEVRLKPGKRETRKSGTCRSRRERRRGAVRLKPSNTHTSSLYEGVVCVVRVRS